MTSFGRQFDFHDIIFTYGIVTLTIDGLTSFLQLLNIQNIRKNTRFSLNTIAGNIDSLFKMAESL